MDNFRVLIVDDEAHQRMILDEFLRRSKVESSSVSSGKEALELISRGEPALDLVLTDLSMPEMDGIELIRRAKEINPSLDFIVITAHGTIETAIRAIKLGAIDYVPKPVELEEVLLKIEKVAQMRRLERQTEHLEKDNRRLRGETTIVVGSQIMKDLLAQIEKAAATDATAMFSGETGSGKEVFARHLHEHSPRVRAPFITVNCSAIPENLLEREFFGHEKGAFTGADKRSLGYFEQASGGSLFLDEIGELDLRLQPKLLRALEERKIRRVGGNADIPVDFRLIVATNRDLEKMTAEGKFREDLYFRLNVVRFSIPPLRDRMEDLDALIDTLVKRHSQRLKIRVQEIDSTYRTTLKKYPFPGNIRELSNIIERSLIFMSSGKLSGESLPADFRTQGIIPSTSQVQAASPAAGAGSLQELVSDFEKELIRQKLAANKQDIDETAKALGVSRSTLYSKISKYGIQS